MRILFDPTPSEGGAGAPPGSPALPEKPANVPETVSIPYTQLQSLLELQSRVAGLEAEKRLAIEAEQQKVVEARIKAGQAEEAVKLVRDQTSKELAEQQRRYQDVESRARSYACDRELSAAIAGRPIVPGQAKNLMTLLRGQLDAYADGNGYVVRTPKFESADDLIGNFLADPANACFLLPTTQGGTVVAGGTSASRAAPTQSDQGTTSKSEIVRFYQNLLASSGGKLNPNADTSLKLG